MKRVLQQSYSSPKWRQIRGLPGASFLPAAASAPLSVRSAAGAADPPPRQSRSALLGSALGARDGQRADNCS